MHGICTYILLIVAIIRCFKLWYIIERWGTILELLLRWSNLEIGYRHVKLPARLTGLQYAAFFKRIITCSSANVSFPIAHKSNVIIPPANEVWGYIGFTLSVCLSVRLSVCLTPVCGHDFFHARDGCMDFSEKLYTHYSPSEDVRLEFSYWFFLFLDLVEVLITRNSVLKIMKNFD